jgi:hypothetical protein
MSKKPTRERKYKSLKPFVYAQPRVFGLSVIRFLDDESNQYMYRPTLELEVSTDRDHMLLLAMDIYDHDLYDVCCDAVIAGLRFTPGYFEDITVFDEDGNVIEAAAPFKVSDIVDEINAPMIDPEELSKDRVLH